MTGESRAQLQSVSGVQCTQWSNSRSRMLLPARNACEIPVLPVYDNTPGDERLAAAADRQLHTVDCADNREAAAVAAAAADDDDDRCNVAPIGNRSSAVRHQQTQPQVPVTSAPQIPFSSAPVPAATSGSHPRRSDRHSQRPHSSGSKDKSSPATSVGQRQSSRPVSQQTRTSSVAVPSQFRISSAGTSSTYTHLGAPG